MLYCFPCSFAIMIITGFLGKIYIPLSVLSTRFFIMVYNKEMQL